MKMKKVGLAFGVGGIKSLGKKASGMVEFMNLAEDSYGDLLGDADSMLLLGVRFREASTSWDISAMRPLSIHETPDEFIAFPFVKGTFLF
ncbi:MAG: hypothetical protein WCY87_04305 [Candidatus Cloacimonadales bacterium]|nr:hypothetical protein [Candidatus Cloacimonadota bacterium]